MADCYETQGDNEKAILRFANVVERYPDGNKAPDALFRQGEVLLKLGPGYQKAARDVFERVVSEYPDSPRAAEAKRQLNLLSAG
jgi:TolA-binding protein